MKLYTKTGDDGTTGLFGGARVLKASGRVEAYGTVDELNACLGVVRAEGLGPEIEATLASLQAELFTLGAELACAPGKEDKLRLQLVDGGSVARLEVLIDGFDARLPALTSFVLPGGSRAAAALHLARTVCRRAERHVLALDDAPVRPDVVRYLNRLSDLLFVLARAANDEARQPEVLWSPSRTAH